VPVRVLLGLQRRVGPQPQHPLHGRAAVSGKRWNGEVISGVASFALLIIIGLLCLCVRVACCCCVGHLLMAAGFEQVHGANTASAGTVSLVTSRSWRAIIVRTRGTVRGIRIISRIDMGG
jgi:choline-glycine betaine transporter